MKANNNKFASPKVKMVILRKSISISVYCTLNIISPVYTGARLLAH